MEHVLSTQTLWQQRPKTLEIRVDGTLQKGVTAKDVILSVIGKYGVKFGTGYVIEYTGEVFRNMSMDERMTVCNMSIEAGARAGLIAPDDTTIEYCKNRKYAPKGEEFEKAAAEWKALKTDPGAVYDHSIVLDGSEISPMVTWGVNPGMVLPVDAQIPAPETIDSEDGKKEAIRAYEYMGISPNQKIEDIKVEHVFIGSCTNSRMTDLRQAADMIKGRKVADSVRAIVVRVLKA